MVLVACGTAHYACHVAKYWFESLARLPVEIEVASEFRYREPPLGPGTLGLFVSQSGETADTLAALRYVKAQGGRIVSVVNVETSTIARESDVALPILAGPEIGVASTKAFTCQLTVLATLAIAAARARGRIDAAEEARLVGDARRRAGPARPGARARAARSPRSPATSPAPATCCSSAAGRCTRSRWKGALKLKEISYIHAEGYASGELKHGPIALIDEEVPVDRPRPVRRALRQDGLEHAGGDGPRRPGAARSPTPRAWPMPAPAPGTGWRCPPVDPFVAPIVYAAPVQLLAYHTAVLKGTDVDQPRNLAKSVTVE